MQSPSIRRYVHPLTLLALCVAGCAELDHDNNDQAEATPSREIIEFKSAPQGARLELPSSTTLAADGELRFVVHNERAQQGQLEVDLYTGSEQGSASTSGVVVVVLPANGRQELSLPTSALVLPRGELNVPAYVHLDATVRYADGTAVRTSAKGLYAEPQGDGWLLYDEDERKQRPYAGALSALARGVSGKWPAGSSLVPARWTSEREFAQTSQRDGVVIKPSVEKVAVPTNPTLCVTMTTNYNDAAFGDQVTQLGDVERAAIGMNYIVEGPCDASGNCAGLVASGTLGDGFGSSRQSCTSGGVALQTESTYVLHLESAGTVGGSQVRARDLRTATAPTFASALFTVPTGGLNQLRLNVTPSPGVPDNAHNLYHGVAFGLSRNPGAVPLNATFDIDPGMGGGYRCWADTVKLEGFMAQLKFIIGHELGHFVHHVNAGFAPNHCDAAANDYGDQGNGDVAGSPFPGACNTVVPPGTPDGHGVFSREWMSASMIEGFADFYSAAIYNDPFNDSDCTYRHLGAQTIDCEGTTTHPDRFALQFCNAPPSGWARDRSSEYDWFKLFWDVRTDAAPTERPSMNDILRWIAQADDATPYTRDNYFRLLHEAANAPGRPAGLRDSWNNARLFTGVNGAPVFNIQALTGKFVRAAADEAGSRAGILLGDTLPGAQANWELFELYNSNPAQLDFSLVANANGLHVAVDTNLPGGALRAASFAAGTNEQFELRDFGDGTFGFLSLANGNFVTAMADDTLQTITPGSEAPPAVRFNLTLGYLGTH
jgi:hypothetical protein